MTVKKTIAIAEQHAAAFARVAAYVIARDGEKVATIAFKFPAGAAGSLYAYVHWLGFPMRRGFAGGYGYDKRTAACVTAARGFDLDAADASAAANGLTPADARPWHIHYRAFLAALLLNDGYDWSRNLEKAGFTVWQAV